MSAPDGRADYRLPVSRQLHDIVVPQLFVLATGLAALKRRTSNAQTSTLVGDLADTAQQTLSDLRSISRGTAIHEGGQLARVGSRLTTATGPVAQLTGCRVDIQVVGKAEISSALEDDLTAVAWEAVANAIRHGQAQEITIEIAAIDALLTVTVTDDGEWGEADEPIDSTGTGIKSLRSRADLWGGDASIERGDGHTVVTWQVPLVTSSPTLATR